MYRIDPLYIHGLGIFSIDGIKMKDGGLVDFMEYVRPCYKYGYWLMLVPYIPSMWRYTVPAYYIQLKENDHNKGVTMYIDGIPKVLGNIIGIINSTRPETTRKKPNCIFEGC